MGRGTRNDNGLRAIRTILLTLAHAQRYTTNVDRVFLAMSGALTSMLVDQKGKKKAKLLSTILTELDR